MITAVKTAMVLDSATKGVKQVFYTRQARELLETNRNRLLSSVQIRQNVSKAPSLLFPTLAFIVNSQGHGVQGNASPAAMLKRPARTGRAIR